MVRHINIEYMAKSFLAIYIKEIEEIRAPENSGILNIIIEGLGEEALENARNFDAYLLSMIEEFTNNLKDGK